MTPEPHYDAKRAEFLERYLTRPEFVDDPTDDPDFRAAVLNTSGFQAAFLVHLLREFGRDLFNPVLTFIARIRKPQEPHRCR